VSVRGSTPGFYRFDGLAFAPSTCTDPGENLKCFRNQPNGAGITWPGSPGVPETQPELTCWSLGPHSERELASQGRWLVTLGKKTMVCPVKDYPDGGEGSKPHCWDAYGRRVDWTGAVWIEDSYPQDRLTGWFHQLCPPEALAPCPPEPTPTPGPTPGPSPSTACYAGPWRMHCKFESCEVPGEPQNAVFTDAVDAAAMDVRARLKLPGLLPNEQLPGYMREVRDELRRRGYCASGHDDDRRISEDEVAVWSAANAFKEHIDISIGTGAPIGFTKIDGDPFMVARGIP
jgi:hypothetical protein